MCGPWDDECCGTDVIVVERVIFVECCGTHDKFSGADAECFQLAEQLCLMDKFSETCSPPLSVP